MAFQANIPQSETVRESRLDALRGVAALSVAAGHCVTAFSARPLYNKTLFELGDFNGTDFALRFLHLLFNADAAVLIFFVLSGHVLFGSLKRSDSNYLAEFGRFTLKRVYRIIPAVAVSFLPLVLFLNQVTALDLVANMLLLKINLNGVTWTLQVEMAAVLVIYLIFLFSRIPVLLLVPFLILSYLFYSDWYPMYFKYFPAFFLGYFVSYLRNYRAALIKTALPAILGLLLSDFFLGYKTNWSLFGQLISASIIISAAPYSRLFRILDWKIFSFLGKISFSFYLYHAIGALIALWVCRQTGLPLGAMSAVGNVLTYMVLSVPITALISSFSFFLVEKPSITAGSKLGNILYDHLLPLDLKIKEFLSLFPKMKVALTKPSPGKTVGPPLPSYSLQDDIVLKPDRPKEPPLS
jgi:peptidoglycan/LPS O-acetylase OafA/YrhL